MSSLSPGSGSRNAWRRGGLAVLLVFALVLALGGVVTGPGGWGGFGWLSSWRNGVRGLVGAGPVGERPTDRVLALGPGLAMDEPAPTGKTWPPQKRVKELPEKRTAYARFYQLSDGRIQAEISAAPVHFRDGKGQWQPIDTRVVDVDRPGFVAGNAKNTFTSLFGDSADRLVRFEYDGRHVELGLAGAPKHVRPRVDGSTVTYAELIDGADLVYEVSPTALKEKIVLRERPTGAVSYEFTLRTGGLVAEQREDGSIAFVRPSGGEPVAVMPAPFMYDDRDDASSPVRKVWSDKVTQRVTQSGGVTTVTVTADGGWLTDPARVYPVVIDPTIRIQPRPAGLRVPGCADLFGGSGPELGPHLPVECGHHLVARVPKLGAVPVDRGAGRHGVG